LIDDKIFLKSFVAPAKSMPVDARPQYIRRDIRRARVSAFGKALW